MIQLFCFVYRRPDLEPEAFDAHWRERHGPLVAGTADVARHLRRYEQNPRLASDRARDPDGADGVAVLEFESIAGFQAFFAESAYRTLIAEDEARFLDRERFDVVITEPARTIVDPGPARIEAPIRMLTRLHRRADLEPAQFHRHWAEEHAPIVREAMGEHLLGYEQNSRLASDPTGDDKTCDGIASVWYASHEGFRAAIGRGAYRDKIAPDEERFLDRQSMRFVFTSPARVFIGPQHG